jgi:hypothetical protein
MNSSATRLAAGKKLTGGNRALYFFFLEGILRPVRVAHFGSKRFRACRPSRSHRRFRSSRTAPRRITLPAPLCRRICWHNLSFSSTALRPWGDATSYRTALIYQEACKTRAGISGTLAATFTNEDPPPKTCLRMSAEVVPRSCHLNLPSTVDKFFGHFDSGGACRSLEVGEPGAEPELTPWAQSS